MAECTETLSVVSSSQELKASKFQYLQTFNKEHVSNDPRNQSEINLNLLKFDKRFNLLDPRQEIRQYRNASICNFHSMVNQCVALHAEAYTALHTVCCCCCCTSHSLQIFLWSHLNHHWLHARPMPRWTLQQATKAQHKINQ